MGRAKKYCAQFPCANLAAGGGYCKQHQPARAPKQADSFYLSTRWRRFRHWYISNHPLCALCATEGRGPVPARMVDHIIELKAGGEPLAEGNCQSLCTRCHELKHARAAKVLRI